MPAVLATHAAAPKYLDPETLQRMGDLDLVAREVVEGVRVGMHKSPLKGFSTEFAQHRPYVQGDELKHIDWRVYARTGRYYLKLYEAETNFNAHILLDASASMRYASGSVSKLEYAKYMAAAMAHLIVDQHDSVGVGVFDDRVRQYLPPKGTKGVVGDIDRILQGVEGEPQTDLGGILGEMAGRIRRKGFVILISDLLGDTDGLIKGLDQLRFAGHNVVVFQTLDPWELTFPFDGTWKFEGLEMEPELVTQPKRIRDAYLSELRKLLKRVEGACHRNRVDYVLVDTSRAVSLVLSEFLIRRTLGGGR